MFVCLFSPEYMLKCKGDAENSMQNCNATHLREGTSAMPIAYYRCAVILSNFNLDDFFAKT